MSGKGVAAICVAAVFLGVTVEGIGAARLSDDPTAMTCREFAYRAAMPWQREGGDWIDSKGAMHGDAQFASAQPLPGGAADGSQWDVTALARAWAAGQRPSGALVLRALSTAKGGTVEFHSREASVVTDRPALIVDWSDGIRSQLAPVADTYLSCNTRYSRGSEPTLRISPTMPVVMVFPFERRPASVIRAELRMVASKRRGSSHVGAYRALPPFGRETPVELGIAADYPRDRNIEKNKDVVFSARFESSQWRNSWSVGSGGRADIVAADEGNAFEPLDGHALRATLSEGQNTGLNVHYRFADAPGGEPDEIYFRYYIRFGANWNPVRDGGKLPGLAGTYGHGGWGQRRSDGTNGWSARGSFTQQREPGTLLGDFIGLGSYVYHANLKTTHGEQWGWNLGPSGLVERGRWYSIEQHVRLNDPNASNGVLRAWIDGQMVFERTDVRYRVIPTLRIEEVWMNVYHGGTKKAQKEMSLYIDNVVVARRYIGPMAE